MPVFFQFEQDFVISLRCIPMIVRYNLDTCGVKLKLEHWNRFQTEEREVLANTPCRTPEEVAAYRDRVQSLVIAQTGSPAKDLPIEDPPAWWLTDVVPELVQDKAAESGVTLTLEQWAALTSLQRFALIKLSRSGHENRNFPLALREFGLDKVADQNQTRSPWVYPPDLPVDCLGE